MLFIIINGLRGELTYIPSHTLENLYIYKKHIFINQQFINVADFGFRKKIVYLCEVEDILTGTFIFIAEIYFVINYAEKLMGSLSIITFHIFLKFFYLHNSHKEYYILIIIILIRCLCEVKFYAAFQTSFVDSDK